MTKNAVSSHPLHKPELPIRWRAIVFACMLLGMLFVSHNAHGAITGTGDCAGIANPQTSDFTCTGDLTVDGGSTLTLQGDVTMTVNGTLTVTGAGSTLHADAANTFVSVVAADITVSSGGSISADASGCAASLSYDATVPGCVDKGGAVTAGYGEGGDDTSGYGSGGGGGYGGGGGQAESSSGGGLGGGAYGSPDLSTMAQGSGGGSNVAYSVLGGAGGGAFKLIVSGTLTDDGTISASGAAGTDSSASHTGGGGSGGSIYISAATLAGSGAIVANGGSGGDYSVSTSAYGGGGGGGGRIYLAYSSADTFSGTVYAMGGNAVDGGTAGGAGSVMIVDDSGAEKALRIGGNGTLGDTLDGSNDGTQHYASITTLSAVGSSGDTRSLGQFGFSTDVVIANSVAVVANTSLKMVGINTLTAADISVAVGAAIHADGLGCSASQSYDSTLPGCVDKGSGITTGFGEGGDDTASAGSGGGGGYGGEGGASEPSSGGAFGGYGYGSPGLSTLMFGSGGGGNTANGVLGGAGGGVVKLVVSGTLTNDGTISADGAAGEDTTSPYTGGGGSGGSVYVQAGTLAGNGLISANGGDGGSTSYSTVAYGGGGGGGGRVYVAYTSADTYSGTIYAMGGNAVDGGTAGSAGSVMIVDETGAEKALSVGGNGTLGDTLDGSSDGTQHYASVATLSSVGSTGNERSLGQFGFSTDVAVTNTVTVIANTTLKMTGIHTLTAADVSVASGGAISADGLGCPASQSYDSTLPGCVDKGSGITTGFGEGGDDVSGGGGAGGGGYGGAGGQSDSLGGGGSGGEAYGSADLTTMMLGSGGGSNVSNNFPGGAGGGAVKLVVSGTLSNDGTISANGAAGQDTTSTSTSAGGSGGSVYITAGTLSGGGTISADGGNGGKTSASSTHYGSGGGGGGRVYIHTTVSNSFAGLTQADGGKGFGGGVNGSAGTVQVIADAPPPPLKGAIMIVN